MEAPCDLSSVDVDSLPNWNNQAFSIMAAAFLLAGEPEKGRSIVRRLFARWDLHKYKKAPNSWALTEIVRFDAAGTLSSALSLENCQERCEALIFIGEAQAEAGEGDAAWETFQQAVAVSGEPEAGLAATSISDIGYGAAYSGREAAARLVAERIDREWVRDYFERTLQNRAKRGINDAARYEKDAAWGLRQARDHTKFYTAGTYDAAAKLVRAAFHLHEEGKFQASQEKLLLAKRAANKLEKENATRLWADIACLHIALGQWNDAFDATNQTRSVHTSIWILSLICLHQAKRGHVAEAISSAKRAEDLIHALHAEGSSMEFALFFFLLLSNHGQKEAGLPFLRLAWNGASNLSVRNEKGAVVPWYEDRKKDRQAEVITALAEAGYHAEAVGCYREAAHDYA